MVKRILAAIAISLVAGLASTLVVAVPAHAGAALTCQTRTWLSSITPADNMYFNTTIQAWVWGNWQVSYCRRSVSWDPSGYRYTSNGQVQVRIRLLNANQHTQSVGPWMTSFGGGPTVVLDGMVEPGQWFQLNFRPVDTPPPGITSFWPLGVARF